MSMFTTLQSLEEKFRMTNCRDDIRGFDSSFVGPINEDDLYGATVYNYHDVDNLRKTRAAVYTDQWKEDNDAVFAWPGIAPAIINQAKHRGLNWHMAGLGLMWSMVQHAPVTAACGHRCGLTTGVRLSAHHKAYRKLVSDLDGYRQYNNLRPARTVREGMTPAESVAADYLLYLENEKWHGTHSLCCRCRTASRWFGLSSKLRDYRGAFAFGCQAEHQAKIGATSRPGDNLWMVAGQKCTISMAEGKIRSWRHYRSDLTHTVGKKKGLDSHHVGWHAGLLRPPLRYQAIREYTRKKWFSDVRLCDNIGPVSGPGNPQRYLCPVCFSTAKGLPSYLFHVARGMSEKAAIAHQRRELRWFMPNKLTRHDPLKDTYHTWMRNFKFDNNLTSPGQDAHWLQQDGRAVGLEARSPLHTVWYNR